MDKHDDDDDDDDDDKVRPQRHLFVGMCPIYCKSIQCVCPSVSKASAANPCCCRTFLYA